MHAWPTNTLLEILKFECKKFSRNQKEFLESFKVDKATKNLRAKWKPPIINVKIFRVPFNIWKVMGGQNYWRAPHFITSLKTIFSKIPKFCAACKIWRADSPRNAHTDYAQYFQYLSSKIHRNFFEWADIKWKANTASIFAFTQRKQASLRCAVYKRWKCSLSKN